MLKVIIAILLLAILASLISGAFFFLKDQGETKRTMYSLGIRVTLAILLVLCISYGLFSGELSMNAPWHQRY